MYVLCILYSGSTAHVAEKLTSGQRTDRRKAEDRLTTTQNIQILN